MDEDLIELARAASLGGKAGNLARLAAAGLPVPEAVVLGPEAVGRELGAEVRVTAARLAPLAVRSSASIEDQRGTSAAGVFASRVGVDAEGAWDAVRAVWDSARTPLAIAYARRVGAPLQIAVILQRFIPGQRVTVYTRAPGRPDDDEVWIEPDGEPLRRAHRDDADPLLALALAAEDAIEATRGADVELIVARDRTWIVQARPIVHPPAREARVRPPPALLAFSADTPGVTWRLDLAHNPDPLSPAQAGLVDAVVRAGASPWRMHVTAGYLYVADGPAAEVEEPADADALRVRFVELVAAIEEVLAAPASSVAEAIVDFVAVHRIYVGAVTPLLGSARRRLVDLLDVPRGVAEQSAALLVPRRAGSIEATMIAAARGEISDAALLAAVRDHAPAWDVAVPTFGERPEVVRAAVARIRASLDALRPAQALAPEDVPGTRGVPRDVLDAAIALAQTAASLGEEDDALYARAQARVRRALLAAGERLGLPDPEDACWLPLVEIADAEQDGSIDIDRARARAAAARAANLRARGWAMPAIVQSGEEIAAPGPGDGALRGRAGSGGVVTGVVHRIAALDDVALVPPGAVVVVQTVTPALAVVIAGARALVSARGGVLDHGAAIARELGLTCVVGCAPAWDALRDGDLVEVNGDLAEIRRLG